MKHSKQPPVGRFAELIAPISIAELLSNYFLKAPLYVPSATPVTKLAGLPGRQELEALLENAGEVRAVFSQLRQAHIAAEDAEDMFHSGATICLTRVEGASEAFISLIESARAELEFSGDVSIRAYWSPPKGGFGPHFDARVVTTLQVHGRKRWWFSEEPIEVLPTSNRWLSEKQRADVETQPVRSVTLAPGDVLCLPPGVVHWASAETESLSYNIALDYVDATVADLLTSALCEELLSDREFRVPLFGDMATPEPMLAVMRKACLVASDALLQASKRPELLLDVWKRAVVADEADED